MYDKLQIRDKDKVDMVLVLFSENPINKRLRNHSVSPKYPGCRSIDAGFDLRIILKEEKDGYQIVTLIKVGTHSELYD
ncbi:MAG: hypothetical protein Q9M97_08650 [Candidatus Gracilibacteria bacterium]|nr:hypothetical protein [Candidatus Gracilibacteria bacterium]